jgi:SpoVK/Ycf46/Vps4 family AAA+-type ATPase
MHSVLRRRLLSLPNPANRTYRVIAGRRFPSRTRAFHTTPGYRLPLNPHDEANAAWSNPVNETNGIPETAETETAGEGFFETQEKVAELDDKSTYGSARRRALRSRKLRELPQPISLPPWFLEKNTLPSTTLPSSESLVGRASTTRKFDSTNYVDIKIHPPEEVSHPPPNPEDGFEAKEIEIIDEAHKFNAVDKQDVKPRYWVNDLIWQEVYATMRASLTLPSKYADEPPSQKTHLLLQCPKDGSTYFLDSLVKSIASTLGAGILKLDAQDIAELGGDYQADNFKANPELPSDSIRNLAYEVYRINGKESKEEQEDMEEEEENEESEEEYPDPAQGTNSARVPSFPRASVIPIATLSGNLSGSLATLFNKLKGGTDQLSSRMEYRGSIPTGLSRKSPFEEELDKWAPLIDRLLSAADDQSRLQVMRKESNESTDVIFQESIDPDLIILIPDYKEIQATQRGWAFLSAMHRAIRARRRSGQKVMIVGTVSSEDLVPSLSRSGIKTLQRDNDAELSRLIVVTPHDNDKSSGVFQEDNASRILEINIRHLKDMIRLRSSESGPDLSALLQQEDWDLKSTRVYASDLDSAVWPFDRVHRLVTLAIGLANSNEPLSVDHISSAMDIIDVSDEAKFEWAREERSHQEDFDSSITPSEDRLKTIRKNCNPHEKKLLNGVIDANAIRTKFTDVHTPQETIEALKTLTSLPLLRPDAFTYGVLATDKIPGLLLYGPPGTGKTLLAKAVAKESGATMLEVSGSDVYDMYVGEGEKNVRAIFTLAKKLTPCVVFIDEADAIFGSRTGQSNRTTHRELINQFLREWDGMNEMSAFIMVATNRPFDLDDAVLRRLPRRLLVDLPTEKDREAILKIHLREELLDHAVDLSDLAKQTPLYSGSDLKNLCVAAALACVREEVEASAKTATTETSPPSSSPVTPTEPNTTEYPKRILHPRHFSKAMEEISASISEDMSSLSAIKKFDEKYGDRRGRRKKMQGWGFAIKDDKDGKEGERRVRVRAEN